MAVRVAIAVVSVGFILGPALAPDRPRAAGSPQWLPFAQGGVEGYYPRVWCLAPAQRSPIAITTFPASGDACDDLAWMGETDAAVLIDRTPSVQQCAPDATLERHGRGLIVLGPAATDETRATAREILARIRRP